MYVKLNGEMVYLWRAVDHEGEILESYVSKTRDKAAALAFMKKALKRHGSPVKLTTDGLRSYGAATIELGCREKQEAGRWANNRVENSHLPFRRRERAINQFSRMSSFRCSPRSTPICTITSASNATLSIDRPTKNDALPPWQNGSSSQASALPPRADVHRGEISSLQTDSTAASLRPRSALARATASSRRPGATSS
jgi:IS1 family transposase